MGAETKPTITRNALKAELYELLWALHEDGPFAPGNKVKDPVETEGLTDEDLFQLVTAYREQRTRELQQYRRIFPALEQDLLALARRNQHGRGTYGFYADDLSNETDSGLSLSYYPREALFKFARLLGWHQVQKVLTCSDCSNRFVETLWVPPVG